MADTDDGALLQQLKDLVNVMESRNSKGLLAKASASRAKDIAKAVAALQPQAAPEATDAPPIVAKSSSSDEGSEKTRALDDSSAEKLRKEMNKAERLGAAGGAITGLSGAIRSAGDLWANNDVTHARMLSVMANNADRPGYKALAGASPTATAMQLAAEDSTRNADKKKAIAGIVGNAAAAAGTAMMGLAAKRKLLAMFGAGMPGNAIQSALARDNQLSRVNGKFATGDIK